MHISSLQSVLLGGLLGFIFLIIPAVMWLVPPPFFSASTVEVPRGASITEVAQSLAAEGVIYSPELIIIPFRISSSSIAAGMYSFNDRLSAAQVVRRLRAGAFGIPQAEVVIPEGFTNEQIANRLVEVLGEANFSRSKFLDTAAQVEGYLYPDTYHLHPDATAKEVIQIMRSNFYQQIQVLELEIKSFGRPLEDVIKMASLIEREAANYDDRRRIAGVLWNRIDIGMPLQVDAVFAPLLGKSTYDLTREDLAIDSPYNLHVNTGLTPTPIANPGLEAIKATIDPIKTEDIFYLSDRAGNFYFAETLDQHNYNRENFLNAGW
ncbi:MAG: endolytic transglycosylase MltG [Candidatus Paceibacterota bacterium]